jgi:hypothetical protein
MRAVIAISCAAALAAAVAGCATQPQSVQTAAILHCPSGESRADLVQLVFGRNDGDKLAVSDDDWRRFIDEVVTPRFPDGLSVMDVQGQWRAPGGTLVREPSKIVYLVLDGGPDDPAKIAHIREDYMQRFHQKSVLLVSQKACVAY